MPISAKTKLFLTYLPLVKSFEERLKSVNFTEIDKIIKGSGSVKDVDSTLPQPHIPLVGETYDYAKLKIAIYGMETRQWGNLIDVMNTNINELITSKDCDDWINGMQYWNDSRTNTFHAFIKKLLITLYDQTPQINHEYIAKSIIYGQYDSYVRWEKIPFVEKNIIKGSNREILKSCYKELKKASGIFDGDSFKKINSLDPDIIILLSWRSNISFDGYVIKKQTEYYKLFECADQSHKYILMVPHPNRMKYLGKSHDNYVNIIKSELSHLYDSSFFVIDEPKQVDKCQFIGELANYVATLDLQLKLSLADIQSCLKYNGYKAANGTEYGNNGVGIPTLLKSSCSYYHNMNDFETENNIKKLIP